MPEARILIVEDEAIEALDLQGRLTRLGYPLPNVVHSGEDAVSKARETHPDLVLMDIMLPGKIDGIQAAEQIRAFLDVPIIFLTAYADEKTLQRAKITEPYAYIVKPFQEKELHIAIDMALYKHAAERKLKESEKWFSTTLRSIGDAVIATDGEGRITFMNPVAESLTGWKQEETANRKLAEVFKIINRDTRRLVEDPVAIVMRKGAVVGLANHTVLLTKNGAEIPIDDRASPVKDDLGNLVGVVLIFRDITEREKAEEARNRRAAELEVSNKELEAFAYSVSHDLRGPLRALDGFSQAVIEEYADKLDDTGKDYLMRVRGAAQQMSRVTEDLLKLSRVIRSELRLELVNLSDIILLIANELKEKQPDRKIEFVIASGIVVTGDASFLQLALRNLLENSWKFTSKINCAKIEFGVTHRDNDKVYFVKDNGIGFDMRYVDNLFKPFQRLHSEKEYPGTGIGLATVQRIIRRHCGRIWAESEKRQGAAFYFTLG